MTDLRARAILALFGLRHAQAQDWPGIDIICNLLEKRFETFLHDDYAVVWEILQRPRPSESWYGWHWCLQVLRGIQELSSCESLSVEKVYQQLVRHERKEFSAQEKNRAFLAIFAILCWTSMTIHPDMQLRQPDNCPLGFLAHGIGPGVFRALKGLLETSGHNESPEETAGNTTLYAASINLFSLDTIGRLKIKWVEDLSSHLHFDRQYRILSVFSLPTFCVASIQRGGKTGALQRLSPQGVEKDSSSMHREVLLSYRLIFGQSSGSRSLSSKLISKLKETSDDVDPFLDTICSTSIPRSRLVRRFARPRIPGTLFPAANLDLDNSLIQADTYSSREDFPHFGDRLLAVQRYNLSQQPSRVRDLWRDRRNPLQWYTFWAVLWVGGIGIMLSVFQLIAAIMQTYYSAPEPRSTD
ncbi:hypothetical protein HC256_000974 [Beauveria bassiana]|nr:hypothetical protein HC256_000974 [Beauveria bassiana]